MIVVDASAALAGLLNDGPARKLLASERLHVPHLIDSEVANVLRRKARHGGISEAAGWKALDTWRHLGMARYPMHVVLDRVWALKENLSAYDAGYVALAEALECSLVTADKRLALAPGPVCPITVVPG